MDGADRKAVTEAEVGRESGPIRRRDANRTGRRRDRSEVGRNNPVGSEVEPNPEQHDQCRETNECGVSGPAHDQLGV